MRDLTAAQHPSYADQSLFSIYVHTDPAADPFPPDSLFHGREITPRIEGRRWMHSLTRVFLLLLEAALYDTEVQNVRFVLVSESDVPLHHGAVVFWQLMNERYSRLGTLRTYIDLLRKDTVRFGSCACGCCVTAVAVASNEVLYGLIAL